jgi:hypothetical protein
MLQPPLFHPAITLSELESHLWEAANILRGSPVDRTDWKTYILPLLFFKRICDVWDEEYQETVETYGEDYPDEHRFQVPENCHWNVVRETPANVGTALQNAMRGIEAVEQQRSPAGRPAQRPDRAFFRPQAGQQPGGQRRHRRRLRIPDQTVRRRHQPQGG